MNSTEAIDDQILFSHVTIGDEEVLPINMAESIYDLTKTNIKFNLGSQLKLNEESQEQLEESEVYVRGKPAAPPIKKVCSHIALETSKRGNNADQNQKPSAYRMGMSKSKQKSKAKKQMHIEQTNSVELHSIEVVGESNDQEVDDSMPKMGKVIQRKKMIGWGQSKKVEQEKTESDILKEFDQNDSREIMKQIKLEPVKRYHPQTQRNPQIVQSHDILFDLSKRGSCQKNIFVNEKKLKRTREKAKAPKRTGKERSSVLKSSEPKMDMLMSLDRNKLTHNFNRNLYHSHNLNSHNSRSKPNLNPNFNYYSGHSSNSNPKLTFYQSQNSKSKDKTKNGSQNHARHSNEQKIVLKKLKKFSSPSSLQVIGKKSIFDPILSKMLHSMNLVKGLQGKTILLQPHLASRPSKSKCTLDNKNPGYRKKKGEV